MVCLCHSVSFSVTKMPKARRPKRTTAVPAKLSDTTASRTNTQNRRRQATTPTVQQEQLPSNSNTNIPSADEIAMALLNRINNSGSSSSVALSSESNLANALSAANNSPVPSNTASESTATFVTATLIPPLTTDPELLNLNRNAASVPSVINSSNGGTLPVTFSSVSLVKKSLPLAYHVNEKFRNSIYSDIYVDFAALLPQSLPAENSFEITAGVKLTTNAQNVKSLTNIFQWQNAFDIFMTIYVGKFPNCTLDLIKYANNLRKLSSDYGFQAAKVYDEEFRKLRYVHRLDWATMHDELWRVAIGQQYNNNGYKNNGRSGLKQKQPFVGRSQQKSDPYPKGFCWRYCQFGKCTIRDCKHKHVCAKCGGKGHATDTCLHKPNATKTTISN